MQTSSLASPSSPWSTRVITAGVTVTMLAIAAWATAINGPAAYADWRLFRGSDSTAAAKLNLAPLLSPKFGQKWKLDLPGRGLSSPILVGDLVVVSASSGYLQDRLHVLAIDAQTGQLVWERQFWATGRTLSHPKTCNAAPTPCSDGQRIFANFSSNDVVCLDLTGQLLWYRGLTHDYPNASNSLGMSASPVVLDDTLVVPVENDSESFTAGLDVTNGTERWRLTRPKKANWTSPIVLPAQGDSPAAVLLQSSTGVDAVVAKTGKELWSYTGGASTIPSSAQDDSTVYVPSQGITALRASSSGGSADVLWRVGRLGPGTGSPVVSGDRLYVINNAGVLLAANKANGDVVWQQRLTGPFSGSAVVAGQHLVVPNEQGQVNVVELRDDAGEIVATVELNDTILCTPAVGSDGVYVRSDAAIWKLGAVDAN